MGRWIDESGVDWDGRLRIATVELETGRRVVFGAPDAPEGVSVGQAVQASCAVPGIFRPFRSGGRTYVDGGAWSLTNMDVADAKRRDLVLCLNPTGSFRPGIAQPAGVIGPVSRGVARTEAIILRGRGARVTIVNPDEASTAAMGSNLMSSRNRDQVTEAGLAQGRRLARGSRAKAA
jgi:NTE family protein